MVSYTAYHPTLGGSALRIADIDPASPGTDVQNGDNSGPSGTDVKWDAWTEHGADTNKPTRGSGLATAIAQAVKTEYESQGRAYKQIDSSGNEHYSVYETNRTISFPVWNGSQSQLPILVTITNDAGQTKEEYQVRADYTSISISNSEPTGFSTEPDQDDYVSWTRYFYDDVTGLPVKSLQYHNIPDTGDGTHETNYYVSAVEYDTQRRVKTTIQTSTNTQHQVVQPTYDWLNRAIETKTGAGDSGLDTGANGDLGTLSLPTLTKVSSTVYDNNGVGDGWMTSQKSYYGTGTNEYTESQPQYTWRGFARGSIQKNGTTDYGLYRLRDVDWMGRTTDSATYTSAPSNWSTFLTDEDYVATTSTDRHNWSQRKYDDLGRVYRTLNYPETQTTKHFESNTYFNSRGSPGCDSANQRDGQ